VIGYCKGALVSWPRGEGAVGVITESIQGGRQVRARFDDGQELTFSTQSSEIKRFLFQPGDPVQLVSGGAVGVIASGKLVGENIYYTVVLPGNAVKTLSEESLRPATLTDPVERLRTGKTGEPRKFALRSTATRYVFANRYDEFTSLGNSRIEAKPHQISVAHRVVSAYPHRFLLCDEVGLGKTIEAGMVLKELRARGVAKRVLILVPASLLSQWQFELKTKFNETFSIYTGDSVKWLKQGLKGNAGENVWNLNDSVIASHGFASYTDERMDEIASVDWDVVIVDEAHHARAYYSGSDRKLTRLYKLVERLADFKEGGRRSLLMLTATPMQLDPRELYSLVELLDPALFPSVDSFQQQRDILPELNRLVAAVDRYNDPEEVARVLSGSDGHHDGVRRAHSVYRELAQRIEAVLGDDLPVERGIGFTRGPERVGKIISSTEGRERIAEALRRGHRLSEVLIRNRKSQVGGFQPRQAFNWPVEQTEEERDAYAEVEHYVREGYQRALETQNNALGFVMVTFQKLMASSSRALATSLRGRRERLAAKNAAHGWNQGFYETAAADEETAATMVERASAVHPEFVSPEELLHLDELVARLDHIGLDSKAKALLKGVEEILEEEPQEKVLIFTQFRETQEMLVELLRERWPVYKFHGGLGVQEKDNAISDFREHRGPCFLVSTEAGGEGRNLQFCHLLVNYDLPWNPMRVEQRIGRVDRLGQKNVVTVFNFSVKGTVEERVLDVLARRIGLFEQTVGGLDPILGEVETDLRKIFRMADDEAKRALERMADSLERRVAAARRAETQLADFIMDARSFQPEIAREIMGREGLVDHSAVTTFVRALLKDQRTHIGPPNDGVYEIVFRESFVSNFPELVKDGGQRRLVCFEPNVARDKEGVEFLTFGHPVVDALVEKVMDDAYEGMAAVRHIRGLGLTLRRGCQFNYALEVGGVNPRKEVFSVFVDDDGAVDEELARQLLGIEAAFDDEWGDESEAVGDPSILDVAHVAAENAASLALENLRSGLTERNLENLRRERQKLQRYFDYRAVAASDKVAHAASVVGRLEASDDPSDQKILPVWRSNLERARTVEDGLADERERRLLDLDRRSMPEAGYSLLGVARVIIHPTEEEAVA
jgi:superfamily II DNA or RNA helicase